MTYRPPPRRRLNAEPTAPRRPRHATESATADVAGGADYSGWQELYAEEKRRGREGRAPDWRGR